MLSRFALTSFVILFASITYAQNVFTVPSTTFAITENSDSLTDLNADIATRVNSSVLTGVTFELDAIGQTKFELSTSTSPVLAFKSGETFDHETTPRFVFRILSKTSASSADGVIGNSLTITLTINDENEKPQVLGDYAKAENGRVFYVQKTPDIGGIPSIVSTQVFRDPEGLPIALKPCADDFTVTEYDMAGTQLTDTTANPNPRGAFGDDAATLDATTGLTRHCPLTTDGANYDIDKDVTRSGRVVNVTTTGPVIRITPIASASSGVRRAVLTFRGWVQSYDQDGGTGDVDANLKISNEAKITVYVKTGANNPPTFGATGYQVRINESIDTTAEVLIGPSPANAWNASDIDGDTLTYRLQGSPASQTCTDTDGTRRTNAVAVGRGCAWLDETELAKGNVKIMGKNLDYESAPPSDRTYRLTLVASDGYNPATDQSIQILVVMQNVDEGLEFNGPINEISQLVVGRVGRTVDLNDYFTDPDGSAINYSVISTNPAIVNASITGSVLTVSPGTTAGSAHITITATTAGLANTDIQTIPVRVRQTNQPPEIVGFILETRLGNVPENQAIGRVFRVQALRYDDPDGDTITARILNSPLFEAVVDPEIGGQTFNGEVGIKLIGKLDFEQTVEHRLQLRLSDGWDDSTTTTTVVVNVVNVNEPPVVAKDPSGLDRTIPPQTVAVNGTGSIDVASYFTDPDREDQTLSFTAAASNTSFATIQVTGTTIQFTGLLETGATPITVTVTARDRGGLTEQLPFQLTVSPNRPPRLVQPPPAQTLTDTGEAEDVPIVGVFVDDDPDDRVARYEVMSSNSAIVIAQISNDGNNVVLIPRAEGQATITITAYDTRGGNTMTSFNVTVLGNSAPEVRQRIATVTLRPDGSRTLELNTYFSDPDNDTLSYSASVDQPSIATTTVTANRTLTIQARNKGTATVTVTAMDPDGESVQSSFLVAVTNDDPVGSGQISTSLTHRNDTDSIDVSSNFSDPDNDALTYSVSVSDDTVVDASIENSTLSLTAVGNGTTRVTVTATDPYNARGSLTFMVTIVNQGPTVVTAIADQATHREGELTVDLGPHFADADNDELTFTAAVTNTRIARAFVVDSDLMLEGIALGSTRVTVTVDDNFGGQLTSFFNLTVQNRSPETTMMLVDQTMFRAMPMVIDLAQSFSDPDMDDLTFEVDVEDTAIVTATIDGSMLTTVGVGVGESDVTVTASDELEGEAATSTFTVTVENQAPRRVMEIEDQSIPRQYMAVVDLSMIFEDPDGDDLTFEANIANNAVASVSIDGSTLTVVAETVNSTLITVTASDIYGGSVQDIFMITVVNQAPVVAAAPEAVTLNRTEMPTLDMSMVFTDPDGDTLTLSAESATPGVARVSVSGFDVTIDPLTLGTTDVTLRVVDQFNESASATFTVTVENLAPRVAMPIPNVSMNRVDPHVVDVSATFVDDDMDTMGITAESGDTNVVTTSVSGTSLTLDGLNLGSTTVTVTAVDTNAGEVSTTFNVTVNNLDPMVATTVAEFMLQVGGETETRDVAAAFSDDGSETLVLSVAVAETAVATATVTGMSLAVTPVARGITALTLTATDAQGATVEQAVRVEVTDTELKKVANSALASFSRAVLNSVSSTIGARLMADADGLYTPFTTYSLDDFAPSGDFVQPVDGFSNASPFADAQMPWSQASSPDSLGYAQNGAHNLASMFGRGFALKLAAAGDPTFWSIWGGVDRQTFEGPDHEGNASSFYFGGDMTMRGQWTFGLAVGRNAGETDYTYGTATQTLDITLTGIYPYVRMQPSDRTTVYGTFGVGSGEVETSIIGGNIDPADLKASIGLFGGRQVVFTMMNGMNFAIVGDYGFANLETDDAPGGAGNLEANTSRIRAGVESSFNLAMGADGSFVPFITVGFRSDSGDDDVADSGVEITGGLRINNPIFSLDANFRTLATYGTDDYSESGFSLMAVLNPSAGATGLNISVAPSWGASTVSQNALWQDDFSTDRFSQMAAFGHLNSQSMKWDSNVSYGFLVLHDRFILTPFIDVRSGYSRYQDFSVGAKLFQSLRSKQDLNVDLKIGQDSSMTGTQEESVRVNARLNF